MHIADMTMFHAPSSGGVRTYLEAKRRRLRTRPDVRHSLLVPGETTSVSDDLYSVPAPPIPFGNGYRFPLRRGGWVSTLLALQPDVIEAGDPYVTAWAALDAGRKLDVPVLGFYHSDLPRLITNRLGEWSGANVDRYVKRLYRHFDRVLAPSQVMADRLDRLGVDNVHIQPLGVDLSTFHPDCRDEDLRRELGLEDHVRLLAFAGRGSREKNLDELLEAARLLGPDYHLLLIGSGMPRHLPDNVSVTGHFCSSTEVARLVASVDVLLHAGTQETFGLVVLEAMACGTPVVAARAGALAENVPLGCGQLCNPHSPHAMARAVQEVFANDPAALGRQARRHVEKHHAWDRVVDGLLGHYHAVTGTRMQPVLEEVTHG
ncbi:glycosyltransferase family 4 protein [Cobetia amphilecti]|uniref:Glycosyltransferase family 1 protein n=1 Tax=Cobetia amphilecti TaxID=1055104 RepID=A0AAP4WVY9_9GAMM|nr:glycosyltransferase family 1 protein [Cobetia amphilecti]MDO6672605.1 glycosyltransferase family 1 protein [Cobetia amphilecti]